MNKIKWKYDKKYRQWWNYDPTYHSNATQFTVVKLVSNYKPYQLTINHFKDYRFNKLKNAKLFAELYLNG